MAVIIKSLADNGAFGSVPGAQIYQPSSGKAALVRNMRFVNTDDAVTVSLTLTFLRTGTSERKISPSPVSIPPHGLFVIEQELSLEATTDSIRAIGVQAGTSTATTSIDYVISGVERDS